MKKKRRYSKIVCGIFCVAVCFTLSGCVIGEYAVFESYLDENGDEHFMLFGQRGENGNNGNKEESEHKDVEENHTIQESESVKSVESDSIVGTSLKRGWTSSDHSILKGRNVSIKEDSILFSIDLAQEKEITISYDMVVNDGEYQLVYIGPDGTAQILQDDKKIQSEEKILFTKGQNQIAILSNTAVFKKIDITITGIEVSDFN